MAASQPASPKYSRIVSLQGRLGLLYTVLILSVGLALSAIGYHMAVVATDKHIHERIDHLTAIVKRDIVYMVRPLQPTLDMLVHGVYPRAQTQEERILYLPLLVSFLRSYPIVHGFFIGYANGDYFSFQRLPVDEEQNAYNAPPKSAYMATSITQRGNTARHELLFYDNELGLMASQRNDDGPSFNPHTARWFQEAMQTSALVEGESHLSDFQEPALLFAQQSDLGNSVVGAAIALRQVSAILRRELPTTGSQLAILRPDGTLIAVDHHTSEENDSAPKLVTVEDLAPGLHMAAHAYMEGQRGRGIEIHDGGREWEASLETLYYDNDAKEAMLLAIPREDLRAGGRDFLRAVALVTMALFIFCVPLVYFAARRISSPLRSMTAKARNIHAFIQDEEESVQSNVSEIQDLDQSMRLLQENIRKILTITKTISCERDFDELLQRVLKETLHLVKADGGVLALLDEEKKILLNQGCACWITGEQDNMWHLTEIWQNPGAVATYQALAQDIVIRASIIREERLSRVEPVDTGFADPEVGRVDAICVPLHDRQEEHIGSMVLFKAVRNSEGDRGGFQLAEIDFIERFVATAAIALENQRLLTAQDDLRDALIHILAGAIDAKSPYTGGHCQRVPVIFQMLLEAACDAQEGPLKEFSLDKNGWEEAKLAAWLHDCGKVTTPEYVLDKATKLETLYDRIHEIRTRFEVLKRDAEIATLQAVLNGADPETARQDLAQELRALDDDFAFVASCNAGGEHMDDDHIARLAAIGQRPWLRTLDKSLGVSPNERERAGQDAGLAPAWETLLMDNPEHIIERGENDRLSPRNSWGFLLDPPEALYNRGELYNLSIRRGTLTEEERYKINDHITQTIIMLESMPLPKHLRKVPEIAGGHHETMDGKGYPRKLIAKEMSWSARMMAVADIFEALTASDRPYKTSKTLRETLTIMAEFKENGHIDQDVYELFLSAGIPQRYAREYLKPEQNDVESMSTLQ